MCMVIRPEKHADFRQKGGGEGGAERTCGGIGGGKKPWAILFTVSSARTHNRHQFCWAMYGCVNTTTTPVTFTARLPVRYYPFRLSFHTTHITILSADA